MEPRKQSPQFARRSAFSLLELLIAVAVIAILFALFLTALPDWQMEGERAACRSNHRDMYNGFLGYALDNDGYLPPGPPVVRQQGTESSQYEIRTSSDWGGWRNHILPYMVPNVPVNANGVASNLQQFPRCTILTSGREHRGNSPGYGGNRNVLFWAKTFENARRFSNPTKRPLITACNWWPSIYSHTHPNANVNRNFFHGYGKEFSRPYVNILLGDGSIIAGEIGSPIMSQRVEFGNAGQWSFPNQSPYRFVP